MKHTSNKVINDLNARELSVVAFICSDSAGNMQVLEYDGRGLATYISEFVESIDVNERTGENTHRKLTGWYKK